MSCNIKRILKFNEAITTVPVRIFDNNKLDITNNCMYSWSNDGVCWSAWTEYTNYATI